ncbi:putative coat protein [Hibiscus yellow blotch virus]|uniref:Putative coat protein n=1 Tax=Hibiscus yellow blotch virus TaxID=2809748 RepID=A0A890CSJ9_9VIRU|nr:putative coat protein [Hibiscus yellow blotch virus]QRG34871.1 putative coat protein [Hibiscus yellow blotch virus]
MNSVLISGLNKSQFNEIIGVLSANGYSVAKVTVANCRSALAVPNHPVKGRRFVYGKSSSVRVSKRLGEANKNSSLASKSSAPSNSLKKGKQASVKEGTGTGKKKNSVGSSKNSSKVPKPVANSSGFAPSSSGTKPSRWADEVEPGTTKSPVAERTVVVPSQEDVEKRLADLKPVRVEGYFGDDTIRRFDAVVNSVNPYGLAYFKLAKPSKKTANPPIEFRGDKPRSSLFRKLMTLGFPVLTDSMLVHTQADDENFSVIMFPGSARECNIIVPISDGGSDYTTAVNAAIATAWEDLLSISSAYDILPILRTCD